MRSNLGFPFDEHEGVIARSKLAVGKRCERWPFPSTRITTAQLAELVADKRSLKLFEPLSSGVWILVHGDRVRTFAQQYIP